MCDRFSNLQATSLQERFQAVQSYYQDIAKSSSKDPMEYRSYTIAADEVADFRASQQRRESLLRLMG